MTMLLGFLVIWMVPGYFVLQAIMLTRYRGGWRKAAALPLLLMMPAFLFSLVAYHQQSNLWPMTMILAAPACCLVLLVVGTLHWNSTGTFLGRKYR
jgi:uncharacterized membrane protein